jgi:hypothetical protein
VVRGTPGANGTPSANCKENNPNPPLAAGQFRLPGSHPCAHGVIAQTASTVRSDRYAVLGSQMPASTLLITAGAHPVATAPGSFGLVRSAPMMMGVDFCKLGADEKYLR